MSMEFFGVDKIEPVESYASVVSAVDLAVDLPVSPTVELSAPAIFCPSSLVVGVSVGGHGTNAYSRTRATR